jgi:hypothetical protein
MVVRKKRGKEVASHEEALDYWRNLDDAGFKREFALGKEGHRRHMQVATGLITTPGSVWEPGCGIGYLLNILPQECTYYGSDINPMLIEKSLQTWESEIKSGRATFATANYFEELEDSNSTFDYIVEANMLGAFSEDVFFEHIPKVWDKTRVGMSITALNKDSHNFSRAKSDALTTYSPRQVEEVVRQLPGIGHFSMKDVVPESYRARKFTLYAYRDSFTGPVRDVISSEMS